MTSTEVVLREPTTNGTVSREWIALLEPAAALAREVAGTGFVPSAMRNNPAAIVAAILYGDELGLGPMQSLAKINVIEGKPSLSAEAQRALILAAGHELRIDEATATRVTVSGRRDGLTDWSSVTWTLDDAKRAGIAGKQNWRQYPRQMLTARATADLARLLFADVIGGLAATEEIEDVDPLASLIALPGTPEPRKTTRRRRTTKKTPTAEARVTQLEEGLREIAGGKTALPHEVVARRALEDGGEGTGDGGENGDPAASPDLPPLPDESPDTLLEPREAPATDEPREGIEAPADGTEVALPDPAEIPLEPAPSEPGESRAGIVGEPDVVGDEPGEVAQDDETTASSVTSSTEDVASPGLLKALNALVGKLRTTEVELEDGSKSVVLSTEQLWAATATRRNVDVETMIELLGGRYPDAEVLPGAEGDDVSGFNAPRLHWAPLRDSLTSSEASDLMLKLEDRARKWGIS